MHSRLTRGKASSRGETKYSALLSSRDRYLLEPIEWPKGSKASCEVWRKDQGLLSRSGRKRVPNLAMTRETRGFSRVEAGFSSYNGEFRLPLVLAQEVQSSIQLVRESWGLLSSPFRAKSPHLGLGPGRNVPLQGRQGYRGRIPVSPGGSRLVSSGSKGLHYPLESRHVTLGAQ